MHKKSLDKKRFTVQNNCLHGGFLSTWLFIYGEKDLSPFFFCLSTVVNGSYVEIEKQNKTKILVGKIGTSWKGLQSSITFKKNAFDLIF